MKLRGVVFGTLAAAVFAAAPAWAEEASKPGLPQLDPTFYPGQIFWLVVFFSLLYVVMARFALPSVQNVLDKRHKKIQDDLSVATKASESAKVLKAEQEKALADVKAKARTIVKDMAVVLSKEAAEAQDVHQNVLHKRVLDATQSIVALRNKMLGDVPALAQDLARDVAMKIAGSKGAAR